MLSHASVACAPCAFQLMSLRPLLNCYLTASPRKNPHSLGSRVKNFRDFPFSWGGRHRRKGTCLGRAHTEDFRARRPRGWTPSLRMGLLGLTLDGVPPEVRLPPVRRRHGEFYTGSRLKYVGTWPCPVSLKSLPTFVSPSTSPSWWSSCSPSCC